MPPIISPTKEKGLVSAPTQMRDGQTSTKRASLNATALRFALRRSLVAPPQKCETRAHFKKMVKAVHGDTLKSSRYI